MFVRRCHFYSCKCYKTLPCWIAQITKSSLQMENVIIKHFLLSVSFCFSPLLFFLNFCQPPPWSCPQVDKTRNILHLLVLGIFVVLYRSAWKVHTFVLYLLSFSEVMPIVCVDRWHPSGWRQALYFLILIITFMPLLIRASCPKAFFLLILLLEKVSFIQSPWTFSNVGSGGGALHKI